MLKTNNRAIIFCLFSLCIQSVQAAAPAPGCVGSNGKALERAMQKKVQFADAAEFISAERVGLQSANDTKTLEETAIPSLAMQQTLARVPAFTKASTTKKLPPLERLYTVRFPHGHKPSKFANGHPKDQWENIIAPMLPIVELKPHTYLPHKSNVESALWHPNNTHITTLAGGKVCVWDLPANKGHQLRVKEKTVKGYELPTSYDSCYTYVCAESETAHDVALNCEGTVLATAAKRHIQFCTRELGYVMGIPGMDYAYQDVEDTIVRFWDAKTGAELDDFFRDKKTIKLPAKPYTGTKLALLWERNASIYDTAKKTVKKLNHSADVVSVSWGCEGTKLVTSTKNSAVVWDAQTGKRIARMPIKTEKKMSANGIAMDTPGDTALTSQSTPNRMQKNVNPPIIASNPNGTHIATASENIVSIWNATIREHTCNFLHPDPVDSLSWNPIGTHLMIVAGKNVYAWDRTGIQTLNLQHQEDVKFATFNTDGTQIFTASSSKNAHVWDAQTGKLLYVLPQNDSLKLAQWSHDNAQFATVAGTEVSLWNPSNYNNLIAGNLTKEQIMLICADPCQRFRQKFPLYVPYPLSNFARDFRMAGVTTAELSRVLRTFTPEVRDRFLMSYNISTKPQTSNGDETDDFLKKHEIFEEALKWLPVEFKDDIKKEIEECVVDAHPRWNSSDALEDLLSLARIQDSEKFKKESIEGHFTAIAAHDEKAFNKHLNPVTVVATNAHGRTPLMQAILEADPAQQRANKIFKTLLDYQEFFILDSTIRESDLAATDDDNNTALTFAVEKSCFHFALKIAQKMDRNPLLHPTFAQQRELANTRKSAYDLALKVKDQNEHDPEYRALMQILKKHRIQKFALCLTTRIAPRAKKPSALAKLYGQTFPEGHAAGWKASTEPLLPFPLKSIKLNDLSKIQMALWIHNDTLVTLSEGKVHFHDSAGKKYHTMDDEATKKIPYIGGTTVHHLLGAKAIARNSTGTQLAVLFEYERSYHSESGHSGYYGSMHAGYVYKTKIYSTNPLQVIENPDETYQEKDAPCHTRYTLTWPIDSARPKLVRLANFATNTVDETVPTRWNYRPLMFRHSEICDASTNRSVYCLQDPGQPNIIAWNQDGTKLVTASKDGTTLDLWNMRECNEFLNGNVSKEHAMLLHTIAKQSAQLRAGFSADMRDHVPCPLKGCARSVQKMGVTTTALVDILLSLHPGIKEKVISHFNVCTERQTKNLDNSDQEDYCVSNDAFKTACAMVTAGEPDEPKAADLKTALEKYSADDHPPLDAEGLHEENAMERAWIYQYEKFRKPTTEKLHAAIVARDLKALNQHLNPISIGDKHLGKTPLMHAIIYYDPKDPRSKAIVDRLLDFEEPLILDRSRSELRRSDLGAVDADGKTALAFAIDKGCLHLILQIAQKMNRKPSLRPLLKMLTEHPTIQAIMGIANIFRDSP